MLFAIGPDKLLVTLFLTEFGWIKRRAVVTGRFGIAGAAFYRAGEFSFDLNAQRIGIITANRAAEDHETVFGRWAHPYKFVGSEHERTDVKRATFGWRNPV